MEVIAMYYLGSVIHPLVICVFYADGKMLYRMEGIWF